MHTNTAEIRYGLQVQHGDLSMQYRPHVITRVLAADTTRSMKRAQDLDLGRQWHRLNYLVLDPLGGLARHILPSLY